MVLSQNKPFYHFPRCVYFYKKRCQLRVVDVVAESNVNVEFQTSSRQFDVVLVAPWHHVDDGLKIAQWQIDINLVLCCKAWIWLDDSLTTAYSPLDKHLSWPVYCLFSCPGQLKRWPCHRVILFDTFLLC